MKFTVTFSFEVAVNFLTNYNSTFCSVRSFTIKDVFLVPI